MQALISPNEHIFDPNTGEVIGERIAEVSENPFEVALPLFWFPCADYVLPDVYYYDALDQQIKLTPEPTTPVVPINQTNTTGAQTL